MKPLYQLAIDPLVLGWRYYWTDISDVVNENFTPTYFFYGKNDLYMQRMCYSQQGPLLERKLRESGAVYECHVYEDRTPRHWPGPPHRCGRLDPAGNGILGKTVQIKR